MSLMGQQIGLVTPLFAAVDASDYVELWWLSCSEQLSAASKLNIPGGNREETLLTT